MGPRTTRAPCSVSNRSAGCRLRRRGQPGCPEPARGLRRCWGTQGRCPPRHPTTDTCRGLHRTAPWRGSPGEKHRAAGEILGKPGARRVYIAFGDAQRRGVTASRLPCRGDGVMGVAVGRGGRSVHRKQQGDRRRQAERHAHRRFAESISSTSHQALPAPHIDANVSGIDFPAIDPNCEAKLPILRKQDTHRCRIDA